ncbi:MAG: geranylgeranyl reductase family protein [Aquificaceae bacterium]|nr:geranylgeranyl reductase family protein [Aquificaceae bacterium]
MKFDVAVVGAGPAGASCAYHLSGSGLRVLLLERERLPRFKLCAGCLSARTLRLLPEGYEGLLINRIRSGRLGFRALEEVRVEAEEDIAYIVDRRFFDHFLVKKAQEKGVELVEAEFLGFEDEGGGYKVFSSKGSFRTEFVVGADGVRSRTAKLLGFKRKSSYRSLEFFTEGRLEEEVLIEIGWVKRGYLWLFPKGDGVSLGVATTGEEDLLKILGAYSSLRGLKYRHPKGWHIPFLEKEGDITLGKGRVLLVGDAAGMADPLLGEGIYYALLAGKLLSEAVLKEPSEPLRAYRRLLNPLLEELLYAGKIARLAYSFQRVAYKMGKGYALRSFYRVLKGEENYKDLYRRGWLAFLKHLTEEVFSGIFRRHERGNHRISL